MAKERGRLGGRNRGGGLVRRGGMKGGKKQRKAWERAWEGGRREREKGGEEGGRQGGREGERERGGAKCVCEREREKVTDATPFNSTRRRRVFAGRLRIVARLRRRSSRTRPASAAQSPGDAVHQGE
eukprot:2417597-Pleurochrysis_carterae.AAC.1